MFFSHVHLFSYRINPVLLLPMAWSLNIISEQLLVSFCLWHPSVLATVCFVEDLVFDESV